MNSLTLDNFWNDIERDYRLTFTRFIDWVDIWKQINNWREVYNGVIKIPVPKFHELPIDMQYGVLCKYFLEQHGIAVRIEIAGDFLRGHLSIGIYNEYGRNWIDNNLAVADIIHRAFEVADQQTKKHESIYGDHTVDEFLTEHNAKLMQDISVHCEICGKFIKDGDECDFKKNGYCQVSRIQAGKDATAFNMRLRQGIGESPQGNTEFDLSRHEQSK